MTQSDSQKHIYIAGAVALLLFGWVLYTPSRSSIASSEIRFVETSENGMQIVPASCPSSPSNPDFPHDTCSSNPAVITDDWGCVIGQQPSPTPGAVLLQWSVAPNSFSPGNTVISPTVGPVAASGNTLVYPTVPTTYKLSGDYYMGFWVGSYSCTVLVNPPPAQVTVDINTQCTPILSCSGNGVLNSCTSTVTPCTGGQVCQSAQCVCPIGFAMSAGQCVASQCPIGFVMQGSQCVFSACPAGYAFQDGACVATNACIPTNYCSDASHACFGDPNPTCSRSCQVCQYGCSGGACLPAPKPTATLSVTPPLVHKGDTVSAQWSAQQVTACTVTSNNGDSWQNDADSDSAVSRSVTPKPITHQVVFTLSCTGVDDSALSVTKIVNVIPSFEETCNPGFVHLNGACVPEPH